MPGLHEGSRATIIYWAKSPPSTPHTPHPASTPHGGGRGSKPDRGGSQPAEPDGGRAARGRRLVSSPEPRPLACLPSSHVCHVCLSYSRCKGARLAWGSKPDRGSSQPAEPDGGGAARGRRPSHVLSSHGQHVGGGRLRAPSPAPSHACHIRDARGRGLHGAPNLTVVATRWGEGGSIPMTLVVLEVPLYGKHARGRGSKPDCGAWGSQNQMGGGQHVGGGPGGARLPGGVNQQQPGTASLYFSSLLLTSRFFGYNLFLAFLSSFLCFPTLPPPPPSPASVSPPFAPSPPRPWRRASPRRRQPAAWYDLTFFFFIFSSLALLSSLFLYLPLFLFSSSSFLPGGARPLGGVNQQRVATLLLFRRRRTTLFIFRPLVQPYSLFAPSAASTSSLVQPHSFSSFCFLLFPLPFFLLRFVACLFLSFFSFFCASLFLVFCFPHFFDPPPPSPLSNPPSPLCAPPLSSPPPSPFAH